VNGLATRLFRSRRHAPRTHGDPAARIESHDRATALRVAAVLRRHGGLPSPHDPRRYEFRSPSDRDAALAAARAEHGWTVVEAVAPRRLAPRCG
jgi:predicted nucleic acid-binding protein